MVKNNIKEKDVDDDLDTVEDDIGLDDEAKEDSFINDDLGDSFGMDDWGMGGYPTPMEKHSDLLKQLTDFSPYHKELVNGWLGLNWNEERREYIKDPNIDPIMNVKCAAWCVGFLKTYTRRNNIITHIGKQEYIYIVEDVIETVWLNIGIRDKEFGINSTGDVLRICVEMEHAAELILMGAGDGKYNKLLSETTQRSEQVQYQQRPMGMESQMSMAPQKLGYMDRTLNFLKGK